VKKNLFGIEEADAAYQCVVPNVFANGVVASIAFHFHDPGETTIGFGCVLFAEYVDHGASVRVMKRHASRWVDTTESCDNR
jgi:uncharacterized protein YaiE (UPF0345 family)